MLHFRRRHRACYSRLSRKRPNGPAYHLFPKCIFRRGRLDSIGRRKCAFIRERLVGCRRGMPEHHSR